MTFTQGPFFEAVDGFPTSLDDLTDVVLTTPATPSYLRYNGSHWVDVAPSQIATDLGLHAVATTGDYNDLTNLPFIPIVLGDLSDVTGLPSTGDVLTYTGSGWEPQAPSGGGGSAQFLDDLLDVDAPGTEGALLQFALNGSVGTWEERVLAPNCVPYMDANGVLATDAALRYNPTTDDLQAEGFHFASGVGMSPFAGVGGQLDGTTLPCFVWFQIGSLVSCAFQGATSCAGNFTIDNTFDLRLTTTGGTINVSPPASIGSSYTLTLPANNGNVGDFLRCTDGSGTLEFAPVSLDAELADLLDVSVSGADDGDILVYSGGSAQVWQATPTRGTAFPWGPDEGALFYRIDLGCLFVRIGSLWLSAETWTDSVSYSGSMATSTHFGVGGTGTGTNVGIRVPYDSRLVWMTLQNSNSNTFSIRILRNNSVVSTQTISPAARGAQWSLGINLTAGDYIAFQNGPSSNALLDPILFFGIRRRGT